jgi:hypothetical protein
MMHPSLAAAWVVAGLLAALDLMWSHVLGIKVVGVVQVAGGAGVVWTMAVVFRLLQHAGYRGDLLLVAEASRRIATLVSALATVIVLSNALITLSYLAIGTRMPLVDDSLARLDSLVGFDWMAWFQVVHSHPWLRLALVYIYDSTLPAIGATLFYLILGGNFWRYHEMLWIFIITGVATNLIAGLLPAMHAPVHYLLENASVVPADFDPNLAYPYLPDLFALHEGRLSEINLAARLEGLVCFPSFHTVLVIIYCYALRRTRLFWPAIALGGITMLSLPTIGGHYLADLPGGAAVAIMAILLVRRWSSKWQASTTMTESASPAVA